MKRENKPKRTSDQNSTKQQHSGRRGDPVSLAPLTPDEAIAAALQVKRSDVDRLEEQDKAKKKRPDQKKK